jgi:imidazolonepropionase-like amidohydrolase
MTRSLMLLASMAALAQAETKVLENFTLIDGTGHAPVANAAIIITDGRVNWVGPKSQLKAPAGAETTDLAGKFIMPGIINAHGHLGNVVDLTQDPKFFTRENVEKQLKLYASYGVTSVLSMGTDLPLIYSMRAEQRAGRPSMTRIFTAGRGFTGKGGYPTTVPGMQGVPYEVSSKAEVEKDVAELADHKVDMVKIWVDDHLGKERKIPLDLSKAIIDSARKHGLRVSAHIFYLDDAKALVNAGLYGLVHSVRDKPVDDELIAAMKKQGAWQGAATLARELSTYVFGADTPMLKDPFFTRLLSPNVLTTISSEAYRKRIQADPDYSKYPGFLATAKKNLKRLSDAGVKIGFGTDTGPPARFPGYFEHLEMELMVDAGLTPMQVITAASAGAAEFLGASKDLGAIQAGHWADLLVLGRNPLENIKNTRSLERVYIAGNVVQ